MHDPSFSPLQESIETRLKMFVSGDVWTQAKDYTQFFLNREEKRKHRMDQATIVGAQSLTQV